ncbi:MAG: hypothetical protein JJV88_02915 [Sulfurovum sp.]|nr:hypothetical protein [Sulfurovaceae bacterium]
MSNNLRAKKKVLLTGGSRGIGKAIYDELEDDFDVYIPGTVQARTEDNLIECTVRARTEDDLIECTVQARTEDDPIVHCPG